MWVDIIPSIFASSIPMQIIQPPSEEEYELRLVIWETRDVELVDEDHVDIFICVIYDPEGWATDVIQKKTDTHYNSKDGRGVFNWRMKFPIKMPCSFPRLKFQLFD
jgi:fer-1-like protein 6